MKRVEVTIDSHGLEGGPLNDVITTIIMVPDNYTDQQIEQQVKLESGSQLVLKWRKLDE